MTRTQNIQLHRLLDKSLTGFQDFKNTLSLTFSASKSLALKSNARSERYHDVMTSVIECFVNIFTCRIRNKLNQNRNKKFLIKTIETAGGNGDRHAQVDYWTDGDFLPG